MPPALVPAYPRMPHLPGSRADAGDVHQRLQVQPGDRVWVQEKLDGSNVSVLRQAGTVIALTRSGHPAQASGRLQTRLFAAWVQHHAGRFLEVLRPGERLAGEWLLYAHGTRYELPHEPFVALDLLHAGVRAGVPELTQRIGAALTLPTQWAGPEGVADPAQLYATLPATGGHGALDPPEGLVYRVERQGRVMGRVLAVAKWVRPGYVSGRYFQADEVVTRQRLPPEHAALIAALAERLLSGGWRLPDDDGPMKAAPGAGRPPAGVACVGSTTTCSGGTL